MTASDLKEWIAIFQMDLVPDGQGGSREAVPPGLTPDIPASVLPLAQGEITASDQLADRVRFKVTIRYEPGITTVYRVLWRDQYLEITGMKNIDTGDAWLELQCERKEAGAQ